MSQPLLPGNVEAEYIADERDNIIESLRDELRDVKRELFEARQQLRQSERQVNSALGSLRRQLSPLYQALQKVFGEIEGAGMEDDSAPVIDSRQKAIWESWKAKMPGRPAQVIDALLLHGEMNSQAIAVAIGIHRNNVPQIMTRINKAGILGKNGNKYFLKQS